MSFIDLDIDTVTSPEINVALTCLNVVKKQQHCIMQQPRCILQQPRCITQRSFYCVETYTFCPTILEYNKDNNIDL